MPEKPEDRRQMMAGYGMAMGLSAEMVATTAVGVGLGYLLDQWLGTKVLFILLGGFLGGAAGIWRIYRQWTKDK